MYVCFYYMFNWGHYAGLAINAALDVEHETRTCHHQWSPFRGYFEVVIMYLFAIFLLYLQVYVNIVFKDIIIKQLAYRILRNEQTKCYIAFCITIMPENLGEIV
jgi:hypothetical protein